MKHPILINPDARPCVHCRYYYDKYNMVFIHRLHQYACPECAPLTIELLRKSAKPINPIKMEDLGIPKTKE